MTVNACEVEAGKDNVLHLAINSGTDLALFNAWLTYIAEQGLDRQGLHRRLDHRLRQGGRGNKTTLEEAAQITGLTVDQISQSADWIAQPKEGGERRRTMFAYEKGLIWGNDNYRTNGALVNVALATGNIGRPGGGCVRMGGHQEGYSRPSDAHVGRPAAYVDKLLIEGKGGVHHIWACDHYKTTLNALKFKQVYKKRTDMVKDAMSAVPYGDRAAMVEAIMGAIKKGGLFAVDVDIVPTKIGQACHVWLPAATSGEMNLTSMNGERRMRLTERYMDPPGQAMPDCLIAARIANHMERVFREQGEAQIADQFKGFDWKTEEDAFMDGYHKHEKGGEFVTYERLRAMGTNGFQEPAVDFKDGKIVGTKRLYADGKFGGKDGKAHVHGDPVARPAGARQGSGEGQVPVSSSTTAAPTSSGRTPISTRRTSSSWTAGLSLHPDEPGRHGGAERQGRAISSRSTTTTARPRRWSIRRRPPSASRPSCCSPTRPACRATSSRRGQRIHHPELQADLGQHPQDRRCARRRAAPDFKSQEYQAG